MCDDLYFMLQMQQAELEDEHQKQANLTALAAIGPRKQRKLDNEQVGICFCWKMKLLTISLPLAGYPASG